MTLPTERTNSLFLIRQFLRDLLDPKLTPRVPLEFRRRAGRCLRHFPQEYEIRELAKSNPNILGLL